jgi:branched-chain amino acid transport system substrate-binding protein
MNNSSVRSAARLSLIAVSALAGCASAPDTSPLVVRIGHVAPLSGPLANLGRDNENGARLAVEELNAKGISIGGRPARFELVAEDDAADANRSVDAARRLVANKVQGVVGHLNSPASIPASKIYSDAGIAQISPSTSNPRYTRNGYKTAFRLVVDDNAIGAALGRHAAATLGARAVAVIDDRTAYGQASADEFETAAKAAGALTVAREFTNTRATDFSAILGSIQAKKPDLIFFGGTDDVAGPMLRQMSLMGLNTRFVGPDGICTGALPRLAGGALRDSQVVCGESGGVDSASKDAMDRFRADYKKRFNTEVLVFAPYTYDAVRLLAAAMVSAQSAEPARYLPALAATSNYAGVTGPISFDDKGDIKNGAVTLYTYKAGKREPTGVVR